MLKDRISAWFNKTPRVFVGVVAAISLSACVAQFRNHGYIPPQETLEQIVVGQSTKETVRSLVGAPPAEGLLETSGWYYVRSQFRHYGAYEPKEITREVLAISFNDAGLVSNVERFGLEDGQVVTLSRRVTQSNVQGITFIEQLLGSVGRIDPATLIQ